MVLASLNSIFNINNNLSLSLKNQKTKINRNGNYEIFYIFFPSLRHDSSFHLLFLLLNLFYSRNMFFYYFTGDMLSYVSAAYGLFWFFLSSNVSFFFSQEQENAFTPLLKVSTVSLFSFQTISLQSVVFFLIWSCFHTRSFKCWPLFLYFTFFDLSVCCINNPNHTGHSNCARTKDRLRENLLYLRGEFEIATKSVEPRGRITRLKYNQDFILRISTFVELMNVHTSITKANIYIEDD